MTSQCCPKTTLNTKPLNPKMTLNPKPCSWKCLEEDKLSLLQRFSLNPKTLNPVRHSLLATLQTLAAILCPELCWICRAIWFSHSSGIAEPLFLYWSEFVVSSSLGEGEVPQRTKNWGLGFKELPSKPQVCVANLRESCLQCGMIRRSSTLSTMQWRSIRYDFARALLESLKLDPTCTPKKNMFVCVCLL